MVAPPEPNGNKFPLRCVIILALALLVNAYTLANLFPYVGMMVKHLMGLSTTNESGEHKRTGLFSCVKHVSMGGGSMPIVAT